MLGTQLSSSCLLSKCSYPPSRLSSCEIYILRRTPHYSVNSWFWDTQVFCECGKHTRKQDTSIFYETVMRAYLFFAPRWKIEGLLWLPCSYCWHVSTVSTQSGVLTLMSSWSLGSLASGLSSNNMCESHHDYSTSVNKQQSPAPLCLTEGRAQNSLQSFYRSVLSFWNRKFEWMRWWSKIPGCSLQWKIKNPCLWLFPPPQWQVMSKVFCPDSSNINTI